MKLMNAVRTYGPKVAVVALCASPLLAHATGGLDTTGATGELSGEVTTDIGLVGTAIFTLAAIAMGVSWVKATFFG